MQGVSGWRSRVAGLTACALVLTAAPAATAKPRSIWAEGGLGAGAALASMVWSPLKLVHAAGGLVVGGLGLLWTGGDGEVSKRVFTRALSGDYVITPDILTGKRPLRFSGKGDDGGDKDKKGGGDGR